MYLSVLRHLEILFEGDLPSLGINVEVYLFAITKITLFFRIDDMAISLFFPLIFC